jgi:tetratricopeptide (TPR) repeat protein
MLSRVMFATLLLTALALAAAQAKPLDQYLDEAETYQRSGNLEEAYTLMEEALGEYPDNATVYAYMGLYRGMQAGATQNVMEAGQRSSESFALLDRAVALDSLNATARFYRGLMGVKVPEFLGKLDGAIRDLEWVKIIDAEFYGTVPREMLARTHDLLGDGYAKKGDTQKAEMAWRKAVEIDPGSATAEAAQAKLAGLAAEKEAPAPATTPQPPPLSGSSGSGHSSGSIDQARDLIGQGNHAEAEKILRQVIASDTTNAAAYKLLGISLAYADRGYDSRIAENTNQRANMAFEAMRFLDRSVALDPTDNEARLIRGAMGVQFPFFVNKLEQGLEDLRLVLDSDATQDMKAQAKYWLGLGYQKKGMSYWTEIVRDDSNAGLVGLALNGMRPAVDHFDPANHPRPVVVIEFLLGFRDELAPQTVVWLEDDKGALVKTVYISGFSGHAKKVQPVLPVYNAETDYADADAVTGASIDVGNHIYVWDLKDSAGKQVAPGTYTVKVEVSHWPTMKYQLVSAAIEIGSGQSTQVVEEGNYIPYFRVQYLP